MPQPETTLPTISSIADHVGGSCEDGYLVQFVLTDEAEYRAWMAWLRDQRIKGLEDAPVFSMAADPQTTLPPAQWMPSCYMDESGPPPRPDPQAWIVRLADGTHALDGGEWDDETGTLLKDGDAVRFDWTVIVGPHEWTGSEWLPPLPPLPEGASDWMAAPEGNPILCDEAAQSLDPGETVTVYCWSHKSVQFDFLAGVLVAGGMQKVRRALKALEGNSHNDPKAVECK